VANVIKKRSTTSTADSVTSDVDDLIVHLEQSDIDMRKKKLSKQNLRSFTIFHVIVLSEYQLNNMSSEIPCAWEKMLSHLIEKDLK
jgi:hypothetical protein